MEETVIDLDKPPTSPYPCMGMDVQEGHASIVISFGPGTFLVQSVTAEQMDGLCQSWLGRHRQGKDE